MKTIRIFTALVLVFFAVPCIVMALDWNIETVDSTGRVGYYTSIALDSSDSPHISYYDATNNDLKYAYRNGTWHIETVDSAIGYTSLALDSYDHPHISYKGDSYPGSLKYAYKNGTWYTETVDNNDVQYYTSLALDSSNDPHISYCGEAYNDDLRYAFRRNGTWYPQTVDDDGAQALGKYNSLALDSWGYPHISYYDATYDNLKYAYHGGGSDWNIQTVDSGRSVGCYTSIALVSDNPHISYHKYRDDNSDLKYAYYDGSSWHIETVDSTGDVGWFTSLALDSSGNPHISYGDYTNGAIKYAYYDGSSWHIETVDSIGNVDEGTYTSLALDSSDNPHISYRDTATDDLKYAYGYPMSPPTVTNFTGASDITVTSARLNGEVTSTGGENPTVHVYWGDNDGETTPGDWDNDEDLGTKGLGTFFTDITGLTPNTDYFYRCYAENSAGDDWADSSTEFTTLSTEGPTIDIECNKDIYDVGDTLRVLFDLNNPGDAFNATVGLWAIVGDFILLPDFPIFASIPANWSIEDYELFSVNVPSGLPSNNGFLCALFDRDTGELLDWDLDIFGVTTPATVVERIDIKNKAEKFVKTLTIADVAQMKPVSLASLAESNPEETVLMQNVPNPFNPETWIPYQLKDSADVTISIYDVSGQLVRKLHLGQKKAGFYMTKDKAAYWDGCNQSGERVSSGIYFYHLEAGSYSATKRMLILK